MTPDRDRSTAGPRIVGASWVLTATDDRLELVRDHEVVIDRGVIADVRPATDPRGSDDRIWLEGHLLLPGFISGHSHIGALSSTRGYVESNPRTRRGRNFLHTMELLEELTDDERDALTAANVLGMLRGGCTTHVEMSLSLKQMQSYVRVARRYGVRGYPSAMVPGMHRIMELWGADQHVLRAAAAETETEIALAVDFAASIEDDLLRPMMAVGTSAAHTPETIRQVREAAERFHGVQIHLQAGFTGGPTGTDEQFRRVWGNDEVPWLAALGLFDPGTPVFGAHCLGLELERDLDLLPRDNFTYVNSPSATGGGVSPGIAPWPEMLAAGVNTSIGIDAHSADYLENIKLAVMYGRARTDFLVDRSAVAMDRPSIWTALHAATIGAAAGLERRDLGRLVPGARADLCSIDVVGAPHGVGVVPPEPLNLLLYANGLSVRNVLTEGVWQLRDGEFVFDDVAEVINTAGRINARIWERLEAEDFFVEVPREDRLEPR
ncbi:amidohydrolase family protein [Georgenia yuyongxinii]|nr:amidohydrolase family protein [Georgenia yuyongxinii]